MSEQQTAVLFLHAQTPLHPGSGTALGVVDLPVQRERHTQWPLIPGSALKGILRDRCREAAKNKFEDEYEERDGRRQLTRSKRRNANENDGDLIAAFGPGKAGDDSSYAGALSITDARLLAFPVRSLKGVFAWTTCPAVLGRLARDLGLAAMPAPNLPPRMPAPGEALCRERSELLLDDRKLVLEEFDFTRSGDCDGLADWLAENGVTDNFTKDRLKDHLVVLHDDDFTHFAKHATEVVARIGLDYDKKTVRKGALFYQEFLPPESLFYAVVFANASRNGQAKSAAQNLEYLRDVLLHERSVLQIGGDETTGKGLCCVKMWTGEKS